MKNFIHPGDVITLAAPTGGVSVVHQECQGQERYMCRALPNGTAVRAAGTSDATVRVHFDGVAVVAAGP